VPGAVFVTHVLHNGSVFADGVVGAYLRVRSVEPVDNALQGAVGSGVHHNGADFAVRASVEVGRTDKFNGGARVFAVGGAGNRYGNRHGGCRGGNYCRVRGRGNAAGGDSAFQRGNDQPLPHPDKARVFDVVGFLNYKILFLHFIACREDCKKQIPKMK